MARYRYASICHCAPVYHCPLTHFTPILVCLDSIVLSRSMFRCLILPISLCPARSYCGPVPLWPCMPVSLDPFYPDPILLQFRRLKPLNVALSHSARPIMPLVCFCAVMPRYAVAPRPLLHTRPRFISLSIRLNFSAAGNVCTRQAFPDC